MPKSQSAMIADGLRIDQCCSCLGGLTCMHCHPVDRPSQTHRIAELEAALRDAEVALADAPTPRLRGVRLRIMRVLGDKLFR